MKVKPKRKPIKWPNGARIAITPCVAFETWPEDLGGPDTLQQENRRSFPRNAVTKRNLAIITDREFGERVGIYRMLNIFEQEKIRTTFSPPASQCKIIRRFSKKPPNMATRSAPRLGPMTTVT